MLLCVLTADSPGQGADFPLKSPRRCKKHLRSCPKRSRAVRRCRLFHRHAVPRATAWRRRATTTPTASLGSGPAPRTRSALITSPITRFSPPVAASAAPVPVGERWGSRASTTSTACLALRGQSATREPPNAARLASLRPVYNGVGAGRGRAAALPNAHPGAERQRRPTGIAKSSCRNRWRLENRLGGSRGRASFSLPRRWSPPLASSSLSRCACHAIIAVAEGGLMEAI